MLWRPAVILALVAIVAVAQATTCNTCGQINTCHCNSNLQVVRPAPRPNPVPQYVKRIVYQAPPSHQGCQRDYKDDYSRGQVVNNNVAYGRGDENVYADNAYAQGEGYVSSGYRGVAAEVAKPDDLCSEKGQYVPAVKTHIPILPKPVVVVSKNWYPCSHHQHSHSNQNPFVVGNVFLNNAPEGINYQHGGEHVVDYNHDDLHGHVVREDAYSQQADIADIYPGSGHVKKPLVPGDYANYPNKPVEYVRDGDSLRLDEDFIDNDEARRYSDGEVNAKTHLSGNRLRQPVDSISLSLVRNAALKAQRAAEVTEEGLAYGFRRLPQEVKEEAKRATDEEGKLYAVEKEIIELRNLQSPQVYNNEDKFTEDVNDNDFEDQYAEVRLRNRGPSYDELGFKKVVGTCGRSIQTYVHERPEVKVAAPPCINPSAHQGKPCNCHSY